MTVSSIAGLLDECAASRPGRPLVLDTAGAAPTVCQVASLSSAAVTWLRDAGVQPGMTEAPIICVSEITDTDEQLENSAGRPIPGAEVRIGVGGEIELRGGNLTPGYLDDSQWDPALTADGWFRGGDRGHLRPDGRIVVTGRTKDLIIRTGENIAPDEIENELLAHPLVDEIAVLGQPDELRGELVCAVVRQSARHRDITLDELCTFLDGRGLMKQKWPERLVVVDDFPMTGLGKVAKAALAQQIAGGIR